MPKPVQTEIISSSLDSRKGMGSFGALGVRELGGFTAYSQIDEFRGLNRSTSPTRNARFIIRTRLGLRN